MREEKVIKEIRVDMAEGSLLRLSEIAAATSTTGMPSASCVRFFMCGWPAIP